MISISSNRIDTGNSDNRVEIDRAEDGRVHVMVDDIEVWSGTEEELGRLTIDTGGGNDVVINRVDGARIETGNGFDHIINFGSDCSIDAGDGVDLLSNFGANCFVRGGRDQDVLFTYDDSTVDADAADTVLASQRVPLGTNVGGEIQTDRPTPEPFDVDLAVIQLCDAMDGLGTNEQQLIDVLSNRSNDEIRAIITAYRARYGKDLVKRIDSETSGDLRAGLRSLLKAQRDESGEVDPARVREDVARLRLAVLGAGTDNGVLGDILTTRSTDQLRAISAEYERIYGESLEHAIVRENSRNTEKLLLAQLHRTNGASAASPVLPPDLEADVDALDRAAHARDGTDEAALIRLLTNRSKEELDQLARLYEQRMGESLERMIERETSSDLEDVLKEVLKGERSVATEIDDATARSEAARLRHAMKGVGTDESVLNEILTHRSQAELQRIAQKYEELFGVSLEDQIRGDTGKDYERALMALLGR